MPAFDNNARSRLALLSLDGYLGRCSFCQLLLRYASNGNQ